MKVHLKYQPENKSNEEMCRELVLEMVDKVVDQTPAKEQSERKRKLEEEDPVASKFSNKEFSVMSKLDPIKLRKVAIQKHEEYLQKIDLGIGFKRIGVLRNRNRIRILREKYSFLLTRTGISKKLSGFLFKRKRILKNMIWFLKKPELRNQRIIRYKRIKYQSQILVTLDHPPY